MNPMNPLVPQMGILIFNVSGEDIPPRSVVVVTGVETTVASETQEAETIYLIDKFEGPSTTFRTATPEGNILVTGSTTIVAGTRGQGYFDKFIYVTIDPDIDNPEVTEEWGPVDGEWHLSRGGVGFVCQGWSENGGLPKRALFFRAGSNEYEGELADSLVAPSNAWTAAEWGTMKIFVPDPTSNTFPQDFVDSGLPEIVFVNRDPSFTGTTGMYCRAKVINGELKITWVECP